VSFYDLQCCRRVIKDTIDQNIEIGDTQSISLDINEVESGGDNSLKILREKPDSDNISLYDIMRRTSSK
jgi:hypothetical protein